MLLQSESLDEAEAAFDEGLRHNPDYPKLYLGKTKCRLKRGVYGDQLTCGGAARLPLQVSIRREMLRAG